MAGVSYPSLLIYKLRSANVGEPASAHDFQHENMIIVSCTFDLLYDSKSLVMQH